MGLYDYTGQVDASRPLDDRPLDEQSAGVTRMNADSFAVQHAAARAAQAAYYGASPQASAANAAQLQGTVGGYGQIQGQALNDFAGAQRMAGAGLQSAYTSMMGDPRSVAQQQLQAGGIQGAAQARGLGALAHGSAGVAAGRQAGALGAYMAQGQAAENARILQAREMDMGRADWMAGQGAMRQQGTGLAQLGMAGMGDWQNKIQAQYAAELDARMKREAFAAQIEQADAAEQAANARAAQVSRNAWVGHAATGLGAGLGAAFGGPVGGAAGAAAGNAAGNAVTQSATPAVAGAANDPLMLRKRV